LRDGFFIHLRRVRGKKREERGETRKRREGDEEGRETRLRRRSSNTTTHTNRHTDRRIETLTVCSFILITSCFDFSIEEERKENVSEKVFISDLGEMGKAKTRRKEE
jgi:hypothetical protein